jgi:hypothetical protein
MLPKLKRKDHCNGTIKETSMWKYFARILKKNPKSKILKKRILSFGFRKRRVPSPKKKEKRVRLGK